MFKRNKIRRMVWQAVNSKIAEVQKTHDQQVLELKDKFKKEIAEAERAFSLSTKKVLSNAVNSIISKFL